MVNLFQAEWKKVSGNRWLAGCAIWIFPIFGFLTMIIVLGIAVFNSDAEANFPWTDLALAPWSIQSSIIARPFILAFAAAIFAVEYEHRTWKIVVPGNRRYVMIISKYLALSAFILLSFFILMVILLIGGMLANLITDSPIEPELTGDTFSEFIGDFALNLTLAFVNTLLLCSMAAFVALFTRSMLFGVLAGVFFVLVEALGLTLVIAIVSALIWEDFGYVYLFTPIYNVGNISVWIADNQALTSPFPQDVEPSLTLVESVLVMATWLAVLMGGSIFIFQRQDLQ